MARTAGVAGVLMAGGLARRMGGGDKGLKRLGGESILARICARVAPQVDALVLNANGDPGRFAALGLPVAADVVADHPGPLAGVLTGMVWAAAAAPGCRYLASFACDAPFVPRDLVARLLEAVRRDGADMACAASMGRTHPVFALWPVALREDLRRAMTAEGIRKVDHWTARYTLATVEFAPLQSAGAAIDPFFNANRPEDLAEAEAHLAAFGD